MVFRSFLIVVFSFFVFSSNSEADTQTRVKWVVDGDTIVITNGTHVRYIGIDAPETAHKNKSAEPFGYKSRAFNRELVEHQKITLKFGKEKKDRYNRILAYVFNEKGAFVNREMVANGYAHVYFHKTNMDKHKILLNAQRKAMEEGRGIWRTLVQNKDEDNAVTYVGNISSMRFHTLDCSFGNKTAKRNRRMFNGKFSAFWEGFAPCGRCIRP